MITLERKTPRMVGVRVKPQEIEKITKAVEAGGYLTQSEWLRTAIREKLAVDEAKLRINETK